MPRAARTFPPFDPIAHALIDLPNSRRGFVRTLAMGVIGALGFGGEAADAACSRSCGACKRCKAGHCRPKPDGTACPAGVCKHGRCVCPGAKPAHCGGICVDLGSDPENCGSCGQACAADEGCDAEGCCLALGTTCQAGQGRCCRGLVCCDGQCRDLSTDAAHCGVCEGGSCGNLAVCQDGACVCPSGATCPTNGLIGCCPAGSGPPSGCCEFPNSNCCPPDNGHDGYCCYAGYSCCHGDCCTGQKVCCRQGCCFYTFTCCPAGSGLNCCPPDTPVCCPANARNLDGYCCPAQTACCAAGCCPTGATGSAAIPGVPGYGAG